MAELEHIPLHRVLPAKVIFESPFDRSDAAAQPVDLVVAGAALMISLPENLPDSKGAGWPSSGETRVRIPGQPVFLFDAYIGGAPRDAPIPSTQLGFVYSLNNTGGLSERVVYHQFHNTLSGLRNGAAVLFNGIRVGEVTDLRLDADHPNLLNALSRTLRGWFEYFKQLPHDIPQGGWIRIAKHTAPSKHTAASNPSDRSAQVAGGSRMPEIGRFGSEGGASKPIDAPYPFYLPSIARRRRALSRGNVHECTRARDV
jgi:hypothetical protein